MQYLQILKKFLQRPVGVLSLHSSVLSPSALLPTTKVIKHEKKKILCHILWCVEGALKGEGAGSECYLLVTSLKTELAIKTLFSWLLFARCRKLS